MRLLITGSRTWTDKIAIEEAISLIKPSTLIHGNARGADNIANEIAETQGINIISCPADWRKYGSAAGPIRNLEMINHLKPDLVVAFCDNLETSKGTLHCVESAIKNEIPTYVWPDLENEYKGE